jgi:hypothetical protein
MELKIIIPKSESNVIFACDIEEKLLNKGIILVYSESEVIGFVTNYDGWLLETITERCTANTLKELVKEFPEYTFILKTK